MHDQIVSDFDGNQKPDLVFWAQGDQTLYFTRIPVDPGLTGNWKLIPVYSYFADSQMEQHGTYPSWKQTNEHEGLAKSDIDGDGDLDILGKPYDGDAPRIDIWLQNGTGKTISDKK